MTIDPKAVLRLVVPQWQGGDEPAYRLGARVLAAIAPDAAGPTETIAVSAAVSGERPVEGGIVSRAALLAQAELARAAIERHRPEAIVTLGGDCLVDLAPIAYLNERYGDGLAVIWIDAHPDVMGPAQYGNAHAHVLGMLLGTGDADFAASVPRPVDPRRVLYVGLTGPTPFETDYIVRHGIAQIDPEAVRSSAAPVTDWLRSTGATHVAVHFDLDVLDPAHHDFLLFRDPRVPPGHFDGVAQGRMSLPEVIHILEAVAETAEVVGLAITEYLPWTAWTLSEALTKLPLLGSGRAAPRP